MTYTNKIPDDFYTKLQQMQCTFDQMEPELAVTVSDPEQDVEGYIVVWNTAISKGGPLEYSGKGGTRISPTVDLEEVKMLARSAALKNAAAGLAMGGAKSGLKADPNEADFEKKYRSFVRLCEPYLLENGGIFGGFGFDIGANPIHARWACDELNSTRCFTGKSIDMGGTDYDREGIAGLGVAVAGKTLLESFGKQSADSSFAVQGMGAMGAAVTRYFSERGGRLTALSDPKFSGSWYFNETVSDLLMEALIDMDYKTAKTLIEKEGTLISNDPVDVLYQDVDIIFPCAVQYVIDKNNASRIKARFMSEGANNPTTLEGYEILHSQGVKYVPDFLANPGGVIAAFVELTSTVSIEENIKTRAKVVEAKEKTIEKITENVEEMVSLLNKHHIRPDEAGSFMALSKILQQ